MVIPLIIGAEALAEFGEVAGELAGLAPRHKALPNSSAISSVDFDPSTGQMVITFSGGNTASYTVDAAVYEALIAAPSPGAFYNSYIKAGSGAAPRFAAPSAAKLLKGLL